MSGKATSTLALATAWAVAATAAAQSPERPLPQSRSAFEAALPPLDPSSPPASLDLPPLEPEIDTQLSAPLQSIEAFEDTPPVKVAAPDEDDALTEVRYSVDVQGLGDLDIQDEFEALSALLPGRGAPAVASQVQLRAQADVLLIERLLRAQGYYDADAAFDLEPATGKTDRLAVSITVFPGWRYHIGEIVITGAPPEPTAAARTALALQTGEPLVTTAVETAEARVALQLPERGCPFAQIGPRDVLLDDQTYTGDYTLPLSAGPRSVFGAVQIAGRPVFGADHVARLARFEPGTLYDSRKVEDLRQALVATGLLSTVAVTPVRTGIAAGGGERVDLRVQQTPAPPRTLAASAGYGTGEGYRLAASWSHRNLLPPEGALLVDAVAGAQEQRFGVTFRRSNAGQRDRTVLASALVSREDRDAYFARSAVLRIRLARESTPIWQKRWTYSAGAELISSEESRFEDAVARRVRDSYLIAALPAQLGYDASDSLLNPTRGWRASARLSPEVSRKDDFSGYLRSLFEATAYAPLGERLVLAGRARIGVIAGVARDDLAPSRRLYAGGGGSVRGFSYQGLGPRDINGDPRGGRSLVEASVEARYRIGAFGVVPFVDVGQVYEATRPLFSDLRVGIGLGGRYHTPFGPLRIDIATPLARRSGEPKVAVYISIGQAF